MTRERESHPFCASRRTVLKYGLATASATAVGSTGASGRPPSTTEESTAERSLMLPYQVTPGARFTVDVASLEWQPRAIAAEGSYRTSVIEYDRAPSARSFLFRRGAALDEGARCELGSQITASPLPAGRPLVGVDVRRVG